MAEVRAVGMMIGLNHERAQTDANGFPVTPHDVHTSVRPPEGRGFVHSRRRKCCWLSLRRKMVRENLAEWVPSAFKERENLLVYTTKAFRVMKKHELPPGTRLVPGKGVFTV